MILSIAIVKDNFLEIADSADSSGFDLAGSQERE